MSSHYSYNNPSPSPNITKSHKPPLLSTQLTPKIKLQKNVITFYLCFLTLTSDAESLNISDTSA
jgi:hypothetical protein